jgi:hypothetical protein
MKAGKNVVHRNHKYMAFAFSLVEVYNSFINSLKEASIAGSKAGFWQEFCSS